MKTTNISRPLALFLMICASIVPFLNANTTLTILAGIVCGFLTQAVIARMDKGKGAFRAISIVIGPIASAAANFILREDRALIYMFAYFLTSLASLLIIFLPNEHSKEKERTGRTVNLHKVPQRETVGKKRAGEKVLERAHVISV